MSHPTCCDRCGCTITTTPSPCLAGTTPPRGDLSQLHIDVTAVTR